MKMAAGAPRASCLAKTELAANDNLTLTACSVSYRLAISVSGSVRLEAANTSTSPALPLEDGRTTNARAATPSRTENLMKSSIWRLSRMVIPAVGTGDHRRVRS